MDLIKEKMKIASRAGIIVKEIEFHKERKKAVESIKNNNYSLVIRISENNGSSDIRSIDKGNYKYDTALHDALIGYFDKVISDYEKELDELIKILK